MNKKSIIWLCMLLLMSAGCSSDEDENVDLGEAKRLVNMLSEAQPIQLTEEQQTFANDNNAFTLNFLKTVNEVDKTGKSFVYSPLSITYVLGMVNDAATGMTEKELQQVLGFHDGGIQAVNEYCKKMVDGLPKVDEKVTLNMANAIFLNKLYTLKEQFQKDMQTYYDAKAEALDFTDPQTLNHINGWCDEKTKGMIPTILDEVDPATVSYLLNAIYFKADWASKFDKKNTKEETDILAVDLGLPSGTKWADRNLCAEAPEASGAFFRWGEVEPYTPLSPAYEFQNAGMDICGTKYDAATVMLGERWRMPTKEQVEELVDECTWEWVTKGEVEGMQVTGKNGNHIFFPATGYNYLKDAALWRKGHSGRCWSGTPSTKYNAYLLGFRPVSWSCRNNLRSFGYCIRPVTR